MDKNELEDLALDLAILLQQGWDIKQAAEKMALAPDVWMQVVGIYCENCE